MKLARVAALALVAFAFASVGAASQPAEASVSVAATFDALVLASDAVVVATPLDASAQYEDGKIWTYTRLRVDSAIAGDAATSSDVYVRAFGGVINHVGMVSEGEPAFTVGKRQLVFLRHMTRAASASSGAYQVTANAQGQYPLITDAATHITQFRRSAATGMLVAPKDGAKRADTSGAVTQTPRITTSAVLASDMIENRAAADVSRDIAAAYRRLHVSQ